jgi:hypothetical protein
MTRVSRLQLEKMQNYASPSGIAGCAKPFSCTWDQLWMQSGNKDTSACAKAHELYVEQHNLAKQANALAELDGATSKGAGTSKKSSKKAKEAVATADASEPNLHAIYQQELEKTKEAADNAKATAEFAAKDMFLFYANLLSVDAKYAWNKIQRANRI